MADRPISPPGGGFSTVHNPGVADDVDVALARFHTADAVVTTVARTRFKEVSIKLDRELEKITAKKSKYSEVTELQREVREEFAVVSEDLERNSARKTELGETLDGLREKIAPLRDRYEMTLTARAKVAAEEIGVKLDALMTEEEALYEEYFELGRLIEEQTAQTEDLRIRFTELDETLDGIRSSYERSQARVTKYQKKLTQLSRPETPPIASRAASAPLRGSLGKVGPEATGHVGGAVSAPPTMQLGKGANAVVTKVQTGPETYVARKTPLSPETPIRRPEFDVAESGSPFVPKGEKSSPDGVTECLDMELLRPLTRAEMKPDSARPLALAALKALVDVHSRTGLRNLDVKRSNMLVAPDDSYKMGDWGNASVDGKKTNTGTIFNTPPEAFQEDSIVSGKQDSYGVAMMIYSCVTGDAHPLTGETMRSPNEISVPMTLMGMNEAEHPEVTQIKPIHVARFDKAVAEAIVAARSHGLDHQVIEVMQRGLDLHPETRISLEEALALLESSGK
ncbi:MAG: hypothetical protein SP1CHLAM54_03850 [Chlamydiia bacterium]|nr:hypothetical protein [Chlamydiia bacterium]MCH9615300.1 hypothetical protein [Chlamydiia bacterium]MCH9628378.1 hypothetical protein [Chlamydiia bacterium]